MEYSFYKTLACKYRTTKRRIIAQYRIGKDIGVKFQDKHGNERIRLLWKGSLARDPYPLGKEADIIHPEYRKLQAEMKNLLTVKANVDRLLNQDERSPQEEQRENHR